MYLTVGRTKCRNAADALSRKAKCWMVLPREVVGVFVNGVLLHSLQSGGVI